MYFSIFSLYFQECGNLLSIYIVGVFAPLTMEGNIIVNGVLASCYASTDHDLAQHVMKPNQWCPELINWIFGIHEGSPVYGATLRGVRKWMHPNDIL